MNDYNTNNGVRYGLVTSIRWPSSSLTRFKQRGFVYFKDGKWHREGFMHGEKSFNSRIVQWVNYAMDVEMRRAGHDPILKNSLAEIYHGIQVLEAQRIFIEEKYRNSLQTTAVEQLHERRNRN